MRRPNRRIGSTKTSATGRQAAYRPDGRKNGRFAASYWLTPIVPIQGRAVLIWAAFVALLGLPDRLIAAEDVDRIVSLAVETGHPDKGHVVLSGADARQQLLVTAIYSSGAVLDVTRRVEYQPSPASIVSVDAQGQISPVSNGEANITIRMPVDANLSSDDGMGLAVTSVAVVVQNIGSEPPINFPNQIVPIFTKLGCNGGGCHGKASGQNGFKLSLLGFEPAEDYEHLVKESRGRRLSPAAPDGSLLLRKAIGEAPHGGGKRLDQDSFAYRQLRRWIAQGMPFGSDKDATVKSIEIFPRQRSMQCREEQQLLVVAHYSDGSVEDVTGNVQFDANNVEMAEITPGGLVKTLDLNGDVAVMARYQGQVGVFRASLPLGRAVDQLPPSANFVDDLVFKKLKALGVPPSAVCDDATFVRRTAVDIAGRLPTADETRAFLANTAPDKRRQWIDGLLNSGDYADYFANKWSAVLRNKRRDGSFTHGTYAFHAWMRDALFDNVPYDQFVRSIIAASGEIGQNPPVAWYREVRDINAQVEDTAQLFLGLRIQCARCHHHPFEKWSQQDYYGFAAFFSRVGRKKGLQAAEDRIYHQRGVAQATNPKTQQPTPPTGLGDSPITISPDEDPRQALADWMASPNNRFFAPALVNRYWKHFFGRGLVDPEDDMRVTNPAANQELLDGLASHFRQSGFDLKDLVRTICNSQTYQLSAEPNEFNRRDKQNFSRYYPKRLPAEVLLDALDQVTGSKTTFGGMPGDTRAVQLPDSSFGSYFLTVFGRPEATSACECERSSEANLAQSLHLLNSGEIQSKLTSSQGRAAVLATDKDRPLPDRLRDLYLITYSRLPSDEELAVASQHIEKATDQKAAFEDIVWALINTKEFLFNH